MQTTKRRYIPAQRDSKGELHFWMPYIKGSVVVNYSQALLEMARKYGRTSTLAAEAAHEATIDDD
jgi:hypothetical protein